MNHNFEHHSRRQSWEGDRNSSGRREKKGGNWKEDRESVRRESVRKESLLSVQIQGWGKCFCFSLFASSFLYRRHPCYLTSDRATDTSSSHTFIFTLGWFASSCLSCESSSSLSDACFLPREFLSCLPSSSTNYFISDSFIPITQPVHPNPKNSFRMINFDTRQWKVHTHSLIVTHTEQDIGDKND